MADEVSTFKAYKDDPAAWNKQCFSQWDSYWATFKERVRQNQLLMENWSDDLEERKNDDTLSRSCLFIPIVNPTVLSRAAHKSKLFWSVENPIRVKPKSKQTPKENAENVQVYIADVLRKDGFKVTYLKKEIKSETWPIVFLCVSETEEESTGLDLQFEKLLLPDIPGFEDKIGPFKEWRAGKKQWRPTVTLRTQEEVFYDPLASDWEHKTYAGWWEDLTLGELVERQETMGYKFNVDVLKKDGEKSEAYSFKEETKAAMEAETKSQGGGEPRWRVLQNYCLVENEEGKREWRFLVSSGKCVLKDVPFPYSLFKYPPIVQIICYPGINDIEGICTVDLLKHIQHATNDAFNITYDANKYNIFPPLLEDSRVTIDEHKIGPGVSWTVDMGNLSGKPSDYIQQLYKVNPIGREFFVVLESLKGLAEQVAGAPQDLMQGLSGDKDEKATKTVLRAEATTTRMAGINILLEVEAMKRVAFLIWAITLERMGTEDKFEVSEGYSETGEPITREIGLTELMGEFVFSVPHLEGLADDEENARKLLEFWGVIREEPFFNPMNPLGLIARYKYIKLIAEKLRVPDFDKILPEEAVSQMVKQIAEMTAPEEEETPPPTDRGLPTEGAMGIEQFLNPENMLGGGM